MSTFDLVSVSMAGIAPAFVLILNVLAIIASTVLAMVWGTMPQQTFNVEPEAEIDLNELFEKHLIEVLEDEEERAAKYDPVDVPYTCPPAPIPPVLIDWAAPMPSITDEVCADLELQEEIIRAMTKPRPMAKPASMAIIRRRTMYRPMPRRTIAPQNPPEWGVWDHTIGAYAAPWAMGAEIRLAMSGI